MNVSVAVRLKYHGFQLAQQLQKSSCLRFLYTAYYGSFLGKNNSEGYDIPTNKVHTQLVYALRSYVFKDESLKIDDRFGKWVAAKLTNEDIVVTWGLQALPIIQRAEQKRIKVVLERGSAHATEQRDILVEEYAALGLDTTCLRSSFSKSRMERELLEYAKADMISIPSSFVKRSFIKHGVDEKKLFINPYGVDLKSFNYRPIPHKPFRIIYAGSISARKGIQYLLAAFKELHLPEAELWLVGKIEDEMKPILQKYNHPAVYYFAPVPQSKLADLYNQCDVFAICSLEEGLAMVQPQALACGLPLICTTNTGGEDIIRDGEEGFVLPIRNKAALKEAISLLYVDRDRCREMGMKASNRVIQGFTWDDYGTRTIAGYKSLFV